MARWQLPKRCAVRVISLPKCGAWLNKSTLLGLGYARASLNRACRHPRLTAAIDADSLRPEMTGEISFLPGAALGAWWRWPLHSDAARPSNR
jgi:hypothetical protein